MATITTPDNIAYLNPHGFYFQITKMPELNYYLQEVNLPQITLGAAMQATSLHDVKLPGETMEFGQLTCSFLIDAKMENYFAIHDWIVGLGYPQSRDEFKALLANPKNAESYSINSKTTSDCELTILDGNNVPLKKFTFVDAFPISLSEVRLTSTDSDMNYISASVTLDYSYYTVG